MIYIFKDNHILFPMKQNIQETSSGQARVHLTF